MKTILTSVLMILSLVVGSMTQAKTAPHTLKGQQAPSQSLVQMVFFGSPEEGFYLATRDFSKTPLILKINPSHELRRALHNQVAKNKPHLLPKVITMVQESDLRNLPHVNKNIRIYGDFISDPRSEKKRRFQFSFNLEKTLYPVLAPKTEGGTTDLSLNTLPSTFKTGWTERPEYLLFRTQERLWVVHFKQFEGDFFHIMNIETDETTVANLLNDSVMASAIENTDPRTYYEELKLNKQIIAKIKNTATMNLTFNGDQHYFSLGK